MSPISGKTDPTGVVYVLKRYIGGRPIIPRPYTNAERPDTDRFYGDGVYDNYPVLKDAYEARRKSEQRKSDRVQAWALAALAAVDDGKPPPPTTRPDLVDVLAWVYRAKANGITRPELCNILDRDGGKISGVLTDLHAAGIIFPLDGVRR